MTKCRAGFATAKNRSLYYKTFKVYTISMVIFCQQNEEIDIMVKAAQKLRHSAL